MFATLAVVSLATAPDVPMDDAAYLAFAARAGRAAGQANAASAQLVEIVTQCIAERWWEMQQTTSPEHWCRVILGVSKATSGKLVRVAREVGDYPVVAAAFAEGRMTLDQVELIVTRAHPMYDATLDDAGRWDIERMKRIIANFSTPKPAPQPPTPVPEPTDGPEPEPAPDPPPAGEFRAGWGDDGRFRGGFDLGPELGGRFEKALGLARGSLFLQRTGVDPEDDDRTSEASSVSAVDALDRLLGAALDGLDANIARGARPGDRTQVVIHVPADNPDAARIHLGPLLPAATRKHLTCDADLRAVITIGGKPIETWARERTVNRKLRILIEHRDGGCVIPGCGRTAYLHVHHLWHWEDGGPTIPSNLCCLCPEHHRMVHAGLLFLLGDPESAEGLVVLDRHRRPWPQPGPLPPSEPLEPAASFAPTLWGGRLHLL